MKINQAFIQSDRPNLEQAVEGVIEFLFDKFVFPHEDELDDRDKKTLVSMTIMLRDLGDKAEAYYKAQEKGYENNPYSLN